MQANNSYPIPYYDYYPSRPSAEQRNYFLIDLHQYVGLLSILFILLTEPIIAN